MLPPSRRAVSMRQHPPRLGRSLPGILQASTGNTPPTGGRCGVPKTGTSVGLILRAGAREAPGCCPILAGGLSGSTRGGSWLSPGLDSLHPTNRAGQLVSNWQPTGRAISMRPPRRFLALSRMLPGIQGGAIYMRHPPRPGRYSLAPSRPRQLAPHQQGGAAPGCCPLSSGGRST